MNNQNLFDKYRDGNHWENHPTIYAQEFEKFLSDAFASKSMFSCFGITDLGCGNGRDVSYFQDMNRYAKGLDNNPQMIALAKETRPLYVRSFYLLDIEQLPFLDNSEDAYFCINVMHYVDQQKVLSEIYRTLRPGGYAFIHFNLLIFDQNYSIDYHQKKSDVYELLKNFEIVEEKVFLREDSLPIPHTHHIMQVILKKN
ncbi:MAG TPA: class I SAM-dependent methyltransferase [Candidatus Absconditabacterales bacterium]|nr:class I SAM-dependent methyltransferase [Candidatus Absconditabacterales bacterium]